MFVPDIFLHTLPPPRNRLTDSMLRKSLNTRYRSPKYEGVNILEYELRSAERDDSR